MAHGTWVIWLSFMFSVGFTRPSGTSGVGPVPGDGGWRHTTDFWSNAAIFPHGVDASASLHHGRAMRTTSQDSSVRLYHLDDGEGGAASSLFYGPLAEALVIAAAQPEDVQAGLFLQTSNDVISYLDYIEG